MKPDGRTLLIAAAVIAAAAIVSIRQSQRPGRTGGSCCPLMTALDAGPAAATAKQVATNAEVQQVIAYYFHGAIRCESCLLIEHLAKSVIEQRFGVELAARRLVFMPVNYELPEHAHFLTDYQLPCPSLVLVRQKDGNDERWKLLGDTWQLVPEPAKFNRYIETEVRRFLGGQEQPTGSNQIGLLPAPDHR